MSCFGNTNNQRVELTYIFVQITSCGTFLPGHVDLEILGVEFHQFGNCVRETITELFARSSYLPREICSGRRRGRFAESRSAYPKITRRTRERPIANYITSRLAYSVHACVGRLRASVTCPFPSAPLPSVIFFFLFHCALHTAGARVSIAI